MYIGIQDTTKHPMLDKLRDAIAECEHNHGMRPTVIEMHADDRGEIASVDGIAVEAPSQLIGLRNIFWLKIEG